MSTTQSTPASSPGWRLMDVLVADSKSPADVEKRFLALESLIKRLEEENQKVGARNLVLESTCLNQRRLLDEKPDENFFKVKAERDAVSEAIRKVGEKYAKVKEELERGETEWMVSVVDLEERCRNSEVERKKMKTDLEAERRAANREIERMGGLVEAIAKEKRGMEVELQDRVLRLEEAVSDWGEMEEDPKDNGQKSAGQFLLMPKMESLEEEIQVGLEKLNCKEVSMQKPTDECTIDFSEDEEEEMIVSCDELKTKVPSLDDSGQKSVDKFLFLPKMESLEEEIQVGLDKLDCKDLGTEKGVSMKNSLECEDLGIEKEMSTQMPTAHCTIEISDDEEEEEMISCDELKTKVPSLEDSGGAIAIQEMKPMPDSNHVGTKDAPLSNDQQKPEDTTPSAESQSKAKRRKFDGPKDVGPWNTDAQMCNAFSTNDELCMEAVCALYRKHASLGAWKYHWNKTPVYVAGLEKSAAVLGESLTGGDREGRMKKSLADLEQENPRGIKHCRFIATNHSKLLFEIYSSNQDPLFKP